MQETNVRQVALDRIDPGRRNPRRNLTHVDELAESLEAYGLLQPIVLREQGERFEIVAGHRRTAAARQLGWREIPAVVRQADEDEAYLLTLIENLQREDLTPKEEAEALEILLRERSWSTRQVAEAVKRSAGYVSRRLRVFEDPILAPLVMQQRLSVSVAEELLPLPPSQRRTLAERAAEEGLDRAQVRLAAVGPIARDGEQRRPALVRRIRDFRTLLRGVAPRALTDAERRELRLLFHDLSMLAKAPAADRPVVVPPLSVSRADRG